MSGTPFADTPSHLFIDRSLHLSARGGVMIYHGNEVCFLYKKKFTGDRIYTDNFCFDVLTMMVVLLTITVLIYSLY